MSATRHLFDLGPERPTTPPEPNITDRELDELREKLREEIETDMTDTDWLYRQVTQRNEVGRKLLVALVLGAEGVYSPDEYEDIREMELARREGEALSNG